MADASEPIRPWLESTVGLAGNRLDTALAVCDKNEIEEVGDLIPMFEEAILDTVSEIGPSSFHVYQHMCQRT